MGFTLEALNDVRRQIAASDVVLRAARERRDFVLSIAGQYPGTLRTYRSGSLATGLMNHPVTDGDCGLVLDRRTYPDLGPDGDAVGPVEVVDAVHEFLAPSVRKRYGNAVVSTMK